MDKKNDDCYFFYYSTCEKGDDCPYRHCVAALGKKEVCEFWLKRRDCNRKNCPKRHMDTKRNRGSILCYYESKESGCMKPHCAYKHTKPRLHLQHAIDQKDPSIILPLKYMNDKNASNKNIEVSTKNGAVCNTNVASSLTSEYDASSESNDEETDSEAFAIGDPLIKHLVKNLNRTHFQDNYIDYKRRQQNHLITPPVAPGSSSSVLNLPARSRKQRIEVGARSVSCHGSRFRNQPGSSLVQRNEAFGSDLNIASGKPTSSRRAAAQTSKPEASARHCIPNENFETNKRSSHDIFWQFDSSKVPLKPKKNERKKK